MGDFHFGATKNDVALNSFVHAWCTHTQNYRFGTYIQKSLLRTHSGMEFIGYSIYLQRRQWHPTLVLLPGKSHGQRSLVGCSPWGR